MDEEKTKKIKTAVRANFDESPRYYDEFEERHGFFRSLDDLLISRLRPPAGASILDVGCGTGVSSAHILDSVPDCRVVGLDISSGMIAAARAAFGGQERLTFVEGDAARLTEYFHSTFDAIVYSASIFLMPDYETSLVQAKELLADGGAVGLTFMDGLYDARGRNALAVADREAGQDVSLKKPVQLAHFHSTFTRLFPSTLTWQEDMLFSTDFLRDFFSIPAMSAGLFPGRPYPERVERVNRLIDHLPESGTVFRWIILVGRP